MGKSVKFKDDNYFDSTGIVHKQELLSDILNKRGIVYDKTLTTTTSSINIKNLNLLHDERYEIYCTLALTSDSEIHITFNKDTSNFYTHQGLRSIIKTGSSGDTSVSGYSHVKSNKIADQMTFASSRMPALLTGILVMANIDDIEVPTYRFTFSNGNA